MKTEFKQYCVIDDNNNIFWYDELPESHKAVMVYNPKTDVWHTKRNYNDYKFNNCDKNPRLKK